MPSTARGPFLNSRTSPSTSIEFTRSDIAEPYPPTRPGPAEGRRRAATVSETVRGSCSAAIVTRQRRMSNECVTIRRAALRPDSTAAIVSPWARRSASSTPAPASTSSRAPRSSGCCSRTTPIADGSSVVCTSSRADTTGGSAPTASWARTTTSCSRRRGRTSRSGSRRSTASTRAGSTAATAVTATCSASGTTRRLILSDSHLLEVHRYVVLNPVRAGLCAHPADHRWSSYRATAGLGAVPGLLDVEAVLSLLAEDPRRARARYRAFVEDGLRSIPTPSRARARPSRAAAA